MKRALFLLLGALLAGGGGVMAWSAVALYVESQKHLGGAGDIGAQIIALAFALVALLLLPAGIWLLRRALRTSKNTMV